MNFMYSKRLTLPIVGIAIGVSSLLLPTVASAHAGSPSAKRMHRGSGRYEQRLLQAVTSGKLTTAQEQAVFDEHKKLLAEVQTAGPSNRRQAIQQMHREATTWAQQNGVKVSWLLGRRALKR
jgi:hypothetical protein